jgi:tetratricopeptide (TPR) repeat protein
MPRFARRLATVLIAAAFFAAPAGQDPWIKITSANFVVYTTASEGSGRDLVRHFEQVRSFFGQAFGESRPSAKPACIIAFGHEKEFEPYRFNESATAYFHSGPSHDFIVMSSSAVEQYPVAVHEFTHMMVHEGGRNFPPWFNEGLAELYSNLRPMGNKIMAGMDIRGRMYSLDHAQWLPLATLLAVDHHSPHYNEKAKTGIFYAESWDLVRMLFLHPAYRPHLDALDAALRRGGSAADLEAVYHKSLAEIEADLKSYYRGGESYAMVFNIQMTKSAESPVVEMAAGMGARLALAELLSSTSGKAEQASTAYTSLEHDYPERWEVEAGLGQFRRIQGKLDEAAKHYARALELGGKGADLFLEYGRVLSYANRLADAIEILGKGAGLYPDDDGIRFELGSAYIRHGNYPAALAELGGMKKVLPAQAYRYFYNLAFAEYRLGKAADAKAHAAKARTFAHNSEDAASLDRLDHSSDHPATQADTGETPRATGDSATPPILAHRQADQESDAPKTQPAPALPSVAGIFEHLECGKSARVHVRVDGRILIYVIADPASVDVRGGDGATVDLQCGPQKPARPIRIEYEPVAGQPDAPGVVRALEFK